MVWVSRACSALGAATLAFQSAYRRENPKPLKKAKTGPLLADRPPDGGGFAGQAVDAPLAAGMPPADMVSTELPELPPAAEPPPSAAYAAGDLIFCPKAAFVERLAGFALDAIVIAILAQFLGFDQHGAPYERLTLFLALAYHVGFWTWKGTTPGGMICQLRVVRTDGKPLEFAESPSAVHGNHLAGGHRPGLSLILRDPERQAWHDRIAGTHVESPARLPDLARAVANSQRPTPNSQQTPTPNSQNPQNFQATNRS